LWQRLPCDGPADKLDGIGLMQIISNIALITINETLIVQLVSFLLFLFIINRIMFRPLRRVMSERSGYIDNLQQEIAEQRIEVQKIGEKIHKREHKLIREAHTMRSAHEDAGNKEAEAIIAATRRETAALKEKTTREVNQQLEAARRQLKNESEALVSNIMEKILDRKFGA
jgi:F-type H+-transporting ATPase subunit b